MNTKERFAQNTKNHTMEVEHDEGLHRCLNIRNGKSSIYQFRITTWPGHLCISGDMGCLTFSRLPDMFEFFRSPDGGINTTYWLEKLVGVDKHREVTQFSNRRFREVVVHEFRSYWQGGTDYVAIRECWDEVRKGLLETDYYDEREARDAAESFEHDGFVMEDFWECNLRLINPNMIWLLHAIVWAINEYDEKAELLRPTPIAGKRTKHPEHCRIYERSDYDCGCGLGQCERGGIL